MKHGILAALFAFAVLGATQAFAFDNSREAVIKALSAEASSVYKNDDITYGAYNAIDEINDMPTRWQSNKNDNEWLYADIGAVKTVIGVDIIWADAYASQYKVLVSTDAKTWQEVFTENNGDGSRNVVRFPAVKARYVKIQGIKSANGDGYGIWDLKVIGLCKKK